MAEKKTKEKTDEAPQTRVSRIRKSITRKYNLGNFENIDITVDQEHEISWSSISDLMEKSANINKLLLKDFNTTVSQVKDELGLTEKKASGQSYKGPKDNGSLLDEDFDKL